MTYILILLFKVLDYWVKKNPKGIVFTLSYYSFLEQVVGHVPQLQKYLECDLALQTFHVRARDEQGKIFRERAKNEAMEKVLLEKDTLIKELTSNGTTSPAMRRNFIKR